MWIYTHTQLYQKSADNYGISTPSHNFNERGNILITIFRNSKIEYFILLAYNCFIILCQFLLCNKVNQLYTYVISSFLDFPPTTPSHRSRSSQSTELPSLWHIADFHQLSISHTAVYIYQSQSSNSSYSSFPLQCLCSCSLGLALYFRFADKSI